ncbi:hypothetical protein KC331_g4611 [Hortaea werneckii]|uniref:PhoD-like phosphatase domain-containing protein n=1 Tax=Hortaea werneckii TaxID=91943 RepID=A0A3M7CPF9_HORWE|nr:hypothetical protein KC331_g4611 [Hortaea werneckii]RMY53959.1 hypothetical protein D0865_04980 [Hortaea werneckii]
MTSSADRRRQSGLWAPDPATGYYEQQQRQPQSAGPYSYYQPPSRTTDQRRSYADRTGQDSGVQRSQSQRVRDLAQGASQKVRGDGDRDSDYYEQQQPPSLTIDPNAVPSNLRNKPWSPGADESLTSPQSAQTDYSTHARNPANADGLLRHGSVPDRSPLQKLEMEFAASKEDKRARMREAESRSQQWRGSAKTGEGDLVRQGSMRHRSRGEGRSASDGSRRHQERSGSGSDRTGERYRRASDALRGDGQDDIGRGGSYAPNSSSRYDRSADPGASVRRSESQRHRHRDAGLGNAGGLYAGTGAGGGDPPVRRNSAAERGKAAHERRKALGQIPPSGQNAELGRSGSNKLQKRPPPATEWYSRQNPHEFRGHRDASPSQDRDLSPEDDRDYPPDDEDPRLGKQALQTDRLGSGGKKGRVAAMAFQDPDPLPPDRVATSPDNPLSYNIPPQTAGGQNARAQVAFAEVPAPSNQQGEQQEKHHRFREGLWHHKEHRGYQPSAPALDEWRGAGIARLDVGDLEFDAQPSSSGPMSAAQNDDKPSAWWEKGGGQQGSRRSSSSAGARKQSQGMAGTAPAPAQYDGPYEEQAQSFRPALFLKCGPLLRYTGMRKESAAAGTSSRGVAIGSSGKAKEIWRGSIMIVTDDAGSDLSSPPTLRLFAQHMDLHSPPPQHVVESGHELPPEYEDPIAGQVKLSRTGRPLYVRPVHDIEGGIDLSREENNEGLYAATRTPLLGPQSSMDGSNSKEGGSQPKIMFEDKSRVKKYSGEAARRYKEIPAIRLHSERGTTFWRFNIEIELGSRQHRVAYRINRGPALGFWVPARGETMNMLFHSCNGFSLSVDPDEFSGPDPLWRDVMNRHQSRPFHVMLGGGDQIYNDAAMRDTKLFKEWLATKNPEAKHRAEFSLELQEELEAFYLERYSMWFSQGLFAMASSQIPMVNIWDDHDIIDGYGSYPHHFMASRVFTGLGAVAFKYYMLFQHQSVVAETEKEEPSWVLGSSPGPYINELSRSVYMRMGGSVGFVGVDCRTERMRDEILSQESWDILFERLRHEIVEGETKHLIVMLGVPIAYPRLNFLENLLTSKVMDPIKALGRTGMLGGFVNKFDGGVEILDDLDDHWTAKHHKAERNWFIQELQDLAAEKSVRITLLGGDVHLGAVGQFYTPQKFGVRKDKDHRYMVNVVSSAIVNTPPPGAMADVLNKRNKVHHLDQATDEGMIPIFEQDVNGTKRNNKHLLPRRNYCIICQYQPGSTPPQSPRFETGSPHPGMDGEDGQHQEMRGRDRRYPPGSMKRRTMSMSRSRSRAGGLIRRLSGSGRSKNPPVSYQNDRHQPPESPQSYGPGMQRSNSMSGPHPDSGSYFPPTQNDPDARPSFRRRPTNLSVKDAKKAAAMGGAPEEGLDGQEDPIAIDLEGGLDISLNMEINQQDPSGATMPYRLLVPALDYDGEADDNVAEFQGHKAGLLERFRGRGNKDHGEDDDGRSPTPSPPPSKQKHGPQHIRGHENAELEKDMLGATGGRRGPRASYDGTEGRGYVQRNDYEQPQRPSGGRSAYEKGYEMSSPPVGAGQLAHVGGAKSPYPGARHSSAPTPSGPGAGERFAARDDYSEGSLTPSEEYGDAPAVQRPGPPARRPSKAERFFGIGEEKDGGGGVGDGRRPSMQQQQRGDVAFEEKRKPSWKIWK